MRLSVLSNVSSPASRRASGRNSNHYEGVDSKGRLVVLDTIVTLQAGEVVDLSADIQPNYDFFADGPDYDALNL